MTAGKETEALIEPVAQAVEEALRYFEGPGATSRVTVGQWGPREVLSHFLFWHDVTVQGVESVAGGGEPFHVDAPVDEMNAGAIAAHAGQGLTDLVEEARGLQERLVKGARALADLDAIVMVRSDGSRPSCRQRLKVLAHHWREHIRELESVAGP